MHLKVQVTLLALCDLILQVLLRDAKRPEHEAKREPRHTELADVDLVVEALLMSNKNKTRAAYN